jgi:hypothetical protein
MLEENKSFLLSIPGKCAHIFFLFEAAPEQEIKIYS